MSRSSSLWASDETPAAAATKVVQKQLVGPLTEYEGHHARFSRVVMPPQVRRVRITDEALSQDAKGARFMSFAVDARFGLLAPTTKSDEGWRQNVVTGCVYADAGQVFIRRGDIYYPSSMLIGKTTAAAPAYVCHSAPVQASLTK
jgi:hypothetical protein